MVIVPFYVGFGSFLRIFSLSNFLCLQTNRAVTYNQTTTGFCHNLELEIDSVVPKSRFKMVGTILKIIPILGVIPLNLNMNLNLTSDRLT